MTFVCRARAPLRLGLAGGGTDVSPYCDTYGGAVLNVTIGRYAYASIASRKKGEGVSFRSLDLDESEVMPDTELPSVNEGLVLHRAAYRVMMEKYRDGKALPLEITTHVDSPMGSGLGSSSALVVAIIEALREALSVPLGEYDVAHLAFHVEREVAALDGGRQDQFAATFGGVNYMEFGAKNQVIVNPLRVSRQIWNELESSLVLAFSGISRSSAKIISHQAKAATKDASKSLEAMHQLRADALDMKNTLLTGDLRSMASILQHSWEAKKRTSDLISNAQLNGLYDSAISAGAMAGKISGAGGGGFMFFLVDPMNRGRVMSTLSEAGCQVSGCHMVSTGAESWRLPQPVSFNN
ncbi:D-glycero-alpha-D-manno-heptose-7-phosphate kinase [Litoreibacter ponti]|uniref:D-glycero-alpha-D-manno-heptose-7-phosphate kinase n=1 Tax=Litoreibacter ponti TaxID=1510457 RepID=A0A2T6BNW0_9RHOB|nr:dehydrogenase [Litoreibacter ponti]PTX57736.1 D-glycero-alpha-D-manno-heptose-7-phosphate kinase [Litoreibacter ponti]